MKIKSETYKFTPYESFIKILVDEKHNILLDPNKPHYLLIKNQKEKMILEMLFPKFFYITFNEAKLKGTFLGYEIIDLSDGYIKNFSDFIKKTEEKENVEKK